MFGLEQVDGVPQDSQIGSHRRIACPRSFGVAIAAIKAIITTTSIISNSVKPVYLRFDILSLQECSLVTVNRTLFENRPLGEST